MPFEFNADLENSNVTPFDQIRSKEFVEGLLKAGSLISMIENKRINTTALFSLLLEKPEYQDFFTEITSSDNFKEALLSLLYSHPSLVKSKITKSVIRKLNGKTKHSNGIRKAPIQQTPHCVEELKE
jgi:hypothetical protein